MDNETPEPIEQLLRPDNGPPLTPEQITGQLFVLDRLVSLLLYDHAMHSMHRAGMVNVDGVHEMARRYETYLVGEAEKQSESVARMARAYAPHILLPLYETLKAAVGRQPSREDQARDAAHAAILLDPDSGQGSIS